MDTVLLEVVGDGGSGGLGNRAGAGLCLTSFLDLGSDEVVKLIESYNEDLYVGTGSNQILHYSQTAEGDRFRKRLVYKCQDTPRKLLLLKHSRILLAVAGNTCLVFPCGAIDSGPLKVFRDVRDVLVAPPLQSVDPNAEPAPERVLILRLNLAKFLLFSDSKASTMSEAQFHGALGGMAMQTPGKCILYDQQLYQLVDMSQRSSKTTLFEHGTANHMVPFSVSESSLYEYLLTIQPDPEAAMAMFVDELGNATRGTLLWLQHGCPIGGVAILWPLVYGVFDSEVNGSNRLVVCSLETLEEVVSCALEDALGKNTKSVDSALPLYGICSVERVTINRELASLQKLKHDNAVPMILSQGNILVFQNNRIWLVHEEILFERLLRDYHNCPNTAIEAFVQRLNNSLPELKSDQLLFCVQLSAVLQMHLDRSEDAHQSLLRSDKNGLVVDPKAAQYILGRDDQIREIQFAGIVEACQRFPSNPLALDKYLLSALTLCKDKNSIAEIRLSAYTSLPPPSVAEFMEYDLNWTCDNTQNDAIIKILQEKNALELLLVAFDRLIDDGDTRPKISEQYCLLLLQKLQSDQNLTPDASKVLERIKNVLDIATYSKVLIGMLELDKLATIDYLQKNKKSTFSNVHRDLLLRLGSDDSDNGIVAQLKIEYLETLLDDRACCVQLRSELLSLARTAYDSDCAANFENLKATFQVENSLASGVWPKLTWPDFLVIAGPHSECSKFVDLYLKLYELTWVIPWDGSHSENSAFDYFCLFCAKENTISSLLMWSDYTTAEFYAMQGHAPTLKFPRYPALQPTTDGVNKIDARTSLCEIFTFYVERFRSDTQNIQYIRHFIATYGKSMFSAGQILEMLPQDLPLVHVKSYFESVLVTTSNELELQHLHKVLCKTSFRKEKTSQQILQK